LLKHPQVCTRLAELQRVIAPLVEAAIVKLIVTERLERLEAIEDRWDALRLRKVRSIKTDDGYQTVTEYEINTALIESLNSVEKHTAIETGQEVDRADISLRGGLAAQAEMLRKAFTLEELEVMDARIEAARNGETKQLPWPTGVPDVQPVLDKTHTRPKRRWRRGRRSRRGGRGPGQRRKAGPHR
jgi:hypothetical protein